MPENWKKYKISEIGDVIGGGTPSTKNNNYYSGNIPWITPRDLSNHKSKYIKKGERSITELGLQKSSAKLMPLGTVLLTSRAPIGYLAIANNNVSTNQGFKSIVVDESKASNEFLFYLLKSNIDILIQNASGSTFQEISGTVVKNLEFLFPPLQEQKSIASILSALDNKIELNLQMNKTLEEMAMALYKHWFVDFGPFQDGEFVDSELGEIPKGWEIKTLGDLLEHQKGFAFKSKWYQDKGKLVVRVSDTTENSIDINTCNKVSEEIALNYLKYSLKRNDIIIATVGSWPPNYASVVGKVIRVPPTAENGLLNQNAVRLHMYYKGKKQQGLLYTTLKTSRFLNYIVNCAQGSASQASIKLTDIFNYPIPYNENIDLDIFTTQIENFISFQNSNIQENQTLTQLRDTLLPKLISGEVRIKDVEKTLSEIL